MKVVAYTCLHYGAIYLGAAIQSVIDAVDRYIVLYSPTPSHNGGVAQLPNPDTKERLFSIAHTIAGNKLVWIEGHNWKYENQHRGAIWEYEPNADVVLILDSDEIWGEGLANEVIKYAVDGGAQYWRCRMIHYWRSFSKGIPRDPAYPVRAIVPKYTTGDRTFTSGRIASHLSPIRAPELNYWINHMGYALPPEYVAYKWSGIHGHQGEMRKDCDWFKDIYMNKERSTDLHPVGSEYWNYEAVNPLDYMPDFMRFHQYYGKEWIE